MRTILVKSLEVSLLSSVLDAKAQTHPLEAINGSLITDIGVSQHHFQIFEEMELSSFSILLHCRRWCFADLWTSLYVLTTFCVRCKRSVFVERLEYQESSILVCPLPKCNYAWCKSCQIPIDVGGPRHSCDGSSELRHLMREKGWKHCPGEPLRSAPRFSG